MSTLYVPQSQKISRVYSIYKLRLAGYKNDCELPKQSPILGTTITLERLNKRGYISLLDIYKQISPQLNEPLYTRTVRSGVRGVLAVNRPSAVYLITNLGAKDQPYQVVRKSTMKY